MLNILKTIATEGLGPTIPGIPNNQSIYIGLFMLPEKSIMTSINQKRGAGIRYRQDSTCRNLPER
jgi:hypothetical protein